MSILPNVASFLSKHVTVEVESIDRMYLHGYVPHLQSGAGVAHDFRRYRGQPYVSSALMNPISTAFVRAIEQFVASHGIPLVAFERGAAAAIDLDHGTRYKAKYPRVRP